MMDWLILIVFGIWVTYVNILIAGFRTKAKRFDIEIQVLRLMLKRTNSTLLEVIQEIDRPTKEQEDKIRKFLGYEIEGNEK